jgi:hypothetical protein
MLPPKLLDKYIARFDELIEQGRAIHDAKTLNEDNEDTVDYKAFTKWRINYLSLLEQVIPRDNIQRKLMEEPSYYCSTLGIQLTEDICVLEAIKDDFEKGFLGDLTLEIEAEIAADYMGQAEQLLKEGQSGKYDHVPAAVLSGAVLEKSLRKICSEQTPPISTLDGKGSPLTLNPLIDLLKKAEIFNELKAKQLRAWADIRNKAAHGDFDHFTRSDVEGMIKGIEDFLATYMV